VAQRPASRRAQRGMALLGLLAVAVMVFAYVLTSRLNAASRFVGIDREHNAKVLSQAKRVLIGWVAMNAAIASEVDPGRLPCPEAFGDFGNPSNEGRTAPSCTLPKIGRLPWRTLGIDKLVDAAGEPLWYAVSPGWAYTSSNLVINSDTPGRLVVDARPDAAVAIVVAPGAPTVIPASPSCTARTQTRDAPPPADGYCNYLDYVDVTSVGSFKTNGLSSSFNDQVVVITVADLMPALEAAIANRMQREFAPALKTAVSTMYTSTRYSGIPAGVPLYPYPVPFANPTTSGYVSASGASNPQGLLPFNQINSTCSAPQPCYLLPVLPADLSVRVAGGAGYGGSLDFWSCSSSATKLLCTGRYREDSADPSKDVRIEMATTFRDVAMGFRELASNPISLTLAEARDDGSTGSWLTPPTTLSEVRMNDGVTPLPDGATPPRGSATIRFRTILPNIDDQGWNNVADFRIEIQRSVFSDHFLLNADPNPATNPQGATTSWIVRNQWYRNSYYAVHKRYTADLLGTAAPDCSTNPSDPAASRCLRFNDDTYNIRALLVLAGRRLDTQTRHSSNVLDYVEFQNGDGGTKYEQRPIRVSKISMSPAADPYYAPWNDRVILVDWDSASPPVPDPINGPQVVSLTPVRVFTLRP